MKKNIVIAVSSTGGHIYPGLALAEELKKNGYNISFIGKKSDIILREGYPLFAIAAGGLKRKHLTGIFFFLAGCAVSIFQSIYILIKLKPSLTVGFGGYISFPVIFASRLLGIRSIIHEQNFIPGLANKYSAVFADEICVSFKDTEKYFTKKKVVFTGDPVRENILKIRRSGEPAKIPLTILVFGGSQGAHGINTAIANQLEKFVKTRGAINFIHITGERDYESVKSAYSKNGIHAEIYKYLFNIETAYQRASLAVCRAGATTIAELIILKIPAILVPYPYSTENHQKANADFLEKHGCGIVLEEKNISLLPDKILELINRPQALTNMAGAYSSINYPEPIKEFLKVIVSIFDKQ